MQVKFDSVTYVPTEAGEKLANAITGFKWANDEPGKIKLMVGDVHSGTITICQDGKGSLKRHDLDDIIKEGIETLISKRPYTHTQGEPEYKAGPLTDRQKMALTLIIVNAINELGLRMPYRHPSELQSVFNMVLNLIGDNLSR